MAPQIFEVSPGKFETVDYSVYPGGMFLDAPPPADYVPGVPYHQNTMPQPPTAAALPVASTVPQITTVVVPSDTIAASSPAAPVVATPSGWLNSAESWFTRTTQLAGHAIPNWALAGGAVALIFMFSGGGKGRKRR